MVAPWLSQALHATRTSLLQPLQGWHGTQGFTPTADDWEALETQLLQADVGVEPTLAFLQAMQAQQAKLPKKRWASGADFWQAAEAYWLALLKKASYGKPSLTQKPQQPLVLLLTGVNGAGKTTTLAKLAHLAKHTWQANPLLIAADTYRAAADEQLAQWAQRVGVPIVRGQAGQDAAALVYTGIAQAKRDGHNVVLVDTAGRLNNQANLMAELGKLNKVAHKQAKGWATVASLVVIEAATGQNALAQVEAFNQVAPLAGCVLTKLEGSAKGGVVLALAQQAKLPVQWVGTGETLDDLHPFNAQTYVTGLLGQANQTAESLPANA